MRLLFLGDIVGRPGRNAVTERLPALRERWRLDCVVINGENAAGGFGITEAICDEILMAGADAITLGNHSWDQREALVFIERQPKLVRPANYPPGTPGRGTTMVETRTGARVLVVNLMGRLFMDPLDDPFQVAERVVAEAPLREVADAILVDFHAEATSRSRPWPITSTGAFRPWSARTPMSRPPTTASCPAARPTSRTPACAATTNRCSAWLARRRSAASCRRRRARGSKPPWARG